MVPQGHNPAHTITLTFVNSIWNVYFTTYTILLPFFFLSVTLKQGDATLCLYRIDQPMIQEERERARRRLHRSIPSP